MTKDIDLQEFERQLAIYGADLSRWENIDVKAVMAFIEKTPQAKVQFDEAMKLDVALASYTVPAMDEEAVHRTIESRIGQPNFFEILPFWQHRTMKAGIVFTVCVALLFVMAVIHGPTPIGGAIDDAAVDEIFVIASADIREQQEMQNMIELLETSVTDETLQQDVDSLLQEEIKILETEDIWSSFMDG